jgi:hypothetical protein
MKVCFNTRKKKAKGISNLTGMLGDIIKLPGQAAVSAFDPNTYKKLFGSGEGKGKGKGKGFAQAYGGKTKKIKGRGNAYGGNYGGACGKGVSYGGTTYGGASYGGASYGGATYGGAYGGKRKGGNLPLIIGASAVLGPMVESVLRKDE